MVSAWRFPTELVELIQDKFGRPYYRSRLAAFGTLCRLSDVCRMSVTFCIVAKRYVLLAVRAACD